MEGRPSPCGSCHPREWCGRAASASRDDSTARPRLWRTEGPVSGLDPAQCLLRVRADQVQVVGLLDRAFCGAPTASPTAAGAPEPPGLRGKAPPRASDSPDSPRWGHPRPVAPAGAAAGPPGSRQAKRSNSARAANRWKTSLPSGVVVSIASWRLRNPTPRPANPAIGSTRCRSDLPM